MIQTQVEKIIDVDEKNGKSDHMLFSDFSAAAGHQQQSFRQSLFVEFYRPI